jgi:hypothetical protein
MSDVPTPILGIEAEWRRRGAAPFTRARRRRRTLMPLARKNADGVTAFMENAHNFRSVVRDAIEDCVGADGQAVYPSFLRPIDNAV